MSQILTNFTWIDEEDDALNLINLLQSSTDYAIDTEFERSRTFYLNPALLQIACENHFYLVDISIPAIAAMVLKPITGMVLHSGSEDLELYYQVTKTKPERVYDTQVAAALSGYGLHVSYLDVVKDLVGVALEKSLSRSDWLARPLSDAQLIYAVEDIAYLNAMKLEFTQRFTDKGLAALFEVLMQQMIAQLNTDHHAEKLFQKLVKSERLKTHEAEKLWRILTWRDKVAQARNKPRNWILKPEQMMAMIKQVKSHKDLFHLGLHPKFVKFNGDSLLQAMFDTSEAQLSDMPKPIKLNSQHGQHLSDMKKRLSEVTARYDIEPSLIINTQGLKKLAFEGGDLSDLATWQALL